METSPGTGPAEIESVEWERIQDVIPIACVDFIPVLRSEAGTVSHVGLILRKSPFGQDKWCHFGGRISKMETVREALSRHLGDTLEASSIVVPAEPVPTYVEQWFPEVRDEFGYDPRKHAVALSFILECSDRTLRVRSGGEAIEFRWIRVEAVPELVDVWPGTQSLIGKLLERDRVSLALTYQALSARALAHNGLIWQTPGLAMTAQAFLLTIALSPAMSLYGRIASSLASIVISLLCIQLMTKHFRIGLSDTQTLEEIDRRSGLLPINAEPNRDSWKWYEKMQSRRLWQVGLWVMLAISAITLCLAIRFPQILDAG